MSAIDGMMNKYTEKAINDGLVEKDGKYTLLTDKGKTELKEILLVCFKLVNESVPSKDFITSAVKVLDQATGTTNDPLLVFKEMMQSVNNFSDVQLLAFLMHERDNDYKYVKSAMSEHPEMSSKHKGLSIVKKPKYDA